MFWKKKKEVKQYEMGSAMWAFKMLDEGKKVEHFKLDEGYYLSVEHGLISLCKNEEDACCSYEGIFFRNGWILY